MQKTLDDLVDRGYVNRADITDHILQALEGRCDRVYPACRQCHLLLLGSLCWGLGDTHAAAERCRLLQNCLMQTHSQL